METALTILATMGIGGFMGLVTRIMLNHGVRLLGVTSDNPYIVVALCGAVSTLFLALGKVAQLLLQRADKAHADLIERMTAAQLAELAGKDAVIAQYQARLDESEARANRYEDRTLRLLDATREAAAVTAQVVAKRGGA